MSNSNRTPGPPPGFPPNALRIPPEYFDGFWYPRIRINQIKQEIASGSVTQDQMFNAIAAIADLETRGWACRFYRNGQGFNDLDSAIFLINDPKLWVEPSLQISLQQYVGINPKLP
ncbi:hypothetical protein AA313_de0203264 [Arthrobotrys entomopaga]|nr:hypothetical protein AA313_de0203264 [Arthrobotrys entomopaga]